MSNGITRWVGLATLITSCVTTTYAADQDVDLPALPEYYAQKQPVPLSQRAKEATAVKGLKGFYFGGKALYGNLSVDNITRQGPAAPPGAVNPTAALSSTSNTGTGFSVYLGYAIPVFRIPSRIEVEYQNYPSIGYNPNPALLPSNEFFSQSLQNSSVKTQVVQGNLYYDWKFFPRFTPYIGGGLGAVFNSTDSTAVDNITLETATTSHSETNLAWNVRAGFRLNLTTWAMADLGYEYISLGKAQWELFGGNTLESDSISANNLMLGLTIQFT